MNINKTGVLMTSANTSLDDSNDVDNISKAKKRKPRKFIVRQCRSWKGKGITFKQLPDLIIDSLAMAPMTKVVYWGLFRTNPCQISSQALAEQVGLRKEDVFLGIKELIKRKIIKIIEEAKGSVPCLYEFEMDPQVWDLQSVTSDLIIKKKREFIKLEDRVSGPPLGPQTKLVVHPSDHKKISGPPLGPQNELSGPPLGPQTKLVVHPSDHKRPHNEIIPENNYENNLSKQEKIEEGQALVDGPPTAGEQMPLALKTLIRGEGKVKTIIAVREGALTSERISTLLCGFR